MTITIPIADTTGNVTKHTIPVTVTTTALNKERPFAATSPWNTPTPASVKWVDPPAVLASSDWWINGDWLPYFAQASDPVWTFQMPDFIAPAWNRNRPAQTFQVRAPANIAASNDDDRVLAVVQPNGDYIEVWRASVDATKRIVTSTGPGWATGNAVTGLGVGGLVANNGNNAGVRAANFSYSLGGRITLANLNGTTPIDHALVVSLPASMLMPGNTYVAPATAGDGAGNGTIKAGVRIGIPAGVAPPAGLTPLATKIFNAAQKYGMFVGDFVGGNVPILQSNNVGAGLWDSTMKKISPLLKLAA